MSSNKKIIEHIKNEPIKGCSIEEGNNWYRDLVEMVRHSEIIDFDYEAELFLKYNKKIIEVSFNDFTIYKIPFNGRYQLFNPNYRIDKKHNVIYDKELKYYFEYKLDRNIEYGKIIFNNNENILNKKNI